MKVEVTSADITVRSREVVLQLLSADAVISSALNQRMALVFPRARVVARLAAISGRLRVGSPAVHTREGKHLVVIAAVAARTTDLPLTAHLVAAVLAVMDELSATGHRALSVALDTRLPPQRHSEVLREITAARGGMDMTLTVHVPPRWTAGEVRREQTL